MELKNLRFSLEKSWKFTPQVLFLIILGIFVNLVFSVSIWYSLKSILPAPEVSEQIPTENIFAVNAQIAEIDEEENTLLVKAIMPLDWDKEWKLFINDETTLATFISWQVAGSLTEPLLEEGVSPEEYEKAFQEILEKLTLSDFKINDVIYLISNGDLAKEYEIKDIQAILLQEIK